MAQVDRRRMKAEPVRVGPQVQLVSLGPTLEAPIGVLRKIDREHAARAALRTMHWTRTTTLVALRFRGAELEQLKYVLHSDNRSKGAKIDPRHGPTHREPRT